MASMRCCYFHSGKAIKFAKLAHFEFVARYKTGGRAHSQLVSTPAVANIFGERQKIGSLKSIHMKWQKEKSISGVGVQNFVSPCVVDLPILYGQGFGGVGR